MEDVVGGRMSPGRERLRVRVAVRRDDEQARFEDRVAANGDVGRTCRRTPAWSDPASVIGAFGPILWRRSATLARFGVALHRLGQPRKVATGAKIKMTGSDFRFSGMYLTRSRFFANPPRFD